MRRWFVSQIGRREQFNLAAGLAQRGLLEQFVTDLWKPNFPEAVIVHLVKSLAERYDERLAGQPVVSTPLAWTGNRLRRRFQRCKYRNWVAEGQTFSRNAVRHMRSKLTRPEDVFIGYTCANLEQLTYANEIGSIASHIQIDPGVAWYDTQERLRQRYPEIEIPEGAIPTEFRERLLAEWSAANVIICHSNHTKACLMSAGVDEAKLKIIPLAFHRVAQPEPRTLSKGRKQIIFLGTACLMKGFHDFVELAKRMKSFCDFHCAGGVRVSSSFLATAQTVVKIHGHLPPQRVKTLLAAGDLLVFPTHSDGFGMVQLEAMACGMPVVASRYCGDVVVDGYNGRRCEAGNIDELEDAVRDVIASEDRYKIMSINATKRVGEFSVEELINKLIKSVENVKV